MTRPLVFAVINITPDSFSDGGQYLDPNAAVARGLRALAEGADVLDLGGESTRPSGQLYGPGQREISAADELARVMPVLTALRRATDAPLSIDTRKAKVAEAALLAGARYVNDVSGGTYEPALLSVVARTSADLILMHTRGTPETMAGLAQYRDLVSEVKAELAARVAAAVEAGVARERLWIDPGLGFAKTPAQGRVLLRELAALRSVCPRVLVGASRKSVLGSPLPPAERVSESVAAAVMAAERGAGALRVHDVEPTVRALMLWERVQSAGSENAENDGAPALR